MDYAAALAKLLNLGYQLTSPEGETIVMVSGILHVEKSGEVSNYSDPIFYTITSR